MDDTFRDGSEMERWWKISEAGLPLEGDRLHTCVEGRYITVFRHKGTITCIDSVCHHAGGPLTMGKLMDIEDVGLTVVLCPWHKFMVSIDGGLKVFQGVDVIGGKPVVSGWKVGKMVQRSHKIKECVSGIYVALELSGEPCVADNDACSLRCGQAFDLHSEPPHQVSAEEISSW